MCSHTLSRTPIKPVQEVFEALLEEPLLMDTSLASAAQLRYLVLKNLALLLTNSSADQETSSAAADRALQLYGQALLLDDGDAVVWNRMGTLVCPQPMRRAA